MNIKCSWTHQGLKPDTTSDLNFRCIQRLTITPLCWGNQRLLGAHLLVHSRCANYPNSEADFFIIDFCIHFVFQSYRLHPAICEIISSHFLISTTLSCGAHMHAIIFAVWMSLRTAWGRLPVYQELFLIKAQLAVLWMRECSLVLSKGPDFHYRHKRYATTAD